MLSRNNINSILLCLHNWFYFNSVVMIYNPLTIILLQLILIQFNINNHECKLFYQSYRSSPTKLKPIDVQDTEEPLPFNENTVNAKHRVTAADQSDIAPCVPGGDLVCAGIGEPSTEEVKQMGIIRNKGTVPVAGKPMHAVVADIKQLWRNSNVKFSMASNLFDSRQKRLIVEAMEEIESKSCVRFQQIGYHESDSVFVTKVEGICGADVGRRSYRGYQRLMLGNECFGQSGTNAGKGVIMHELMHILGFYHEMARPDRDQHVLIHWNNIQNGMEYNFDKYVSQLINTLGLPYDYDSIMHYSKYDFSRTGYIPTVSTRNSYSGNLGQRSYLSHFDVLKLNKAYNCGGYNSLEIKPNKIPQKPKVSKKKGYDYYWY